VAMEEAAYLAQSILPTFLRAVSATLGYRCIQCQTELTRAYTKPRERERERERGRDVGPRNTFQLSERWLEDFGFHRRLRYMDNPIETFRPPSSSS